MSAYKYCLKRRDNFGGWLQAHKIKVKNEGWIISKDVKVGDYVFTGNKDGYVKVTKIFSFQNKNVGKYGGTYFTHDLIIKTKTRNITWTRYAGYDDIMRRNVINFELEKVHSVRLKISDRKYYTVKTY